MGMLPGACATRRPRLPGALETEAGGLTPVLAGADQVASSVTSCTESSVKRANAESDRVVEGERTGAKGTTWTLRTVAGVTVATMASETTFEKRARTWAVPASWALSVPGAPKLKDTVLASVVSK